MEDFIFYEGPPPDGYQQSVVPTLFNSHHHRLLQHAEGWHSFFAVNKKQERVLASIHFHVDGAIACSPSRAPFGSYEASRELPNIILFKFMEFVESRLKALEVTDILLKNPPALYQPDHHVLLQTFLFNLGYTVTEAELGAVLQVSENSFESHPDTWERRKLRHAHGSGLEFRPIPLEELAAVYLFILACRKQRGYSLSMTLPELKNTVSHFKDHYLLFGIFDNNQLVAASIAIKVSKNVLYNFYSAHSPEYNIVSPVVMLVEGLYQFCQTHRIRLLDLGTSAVEGKPNFGLLDFKLRLGAQPTTKLTFGKKLL